MLNLLTLPERIGVDLKTENEYWTQSSNMSSLDTRGELIRHKDCCMLWDAFCSEERQKEGTSVPDLHASAASAFEACQEARDSWTQLSCTVHS